MSSDFSHFWKRKGLSVSFQQVVRSHQKSISQMIRVCFPVLLLSLPLLAADSVVEVEERSLQQGQESQVRVEAMDDEATRLLREYRDLQRQADSLQAYNENLEQMIGSQEEEIASLERQIEDIQVTQREIVPLMLRMLDALDGYVERDLPFLLAERRERVLGLHALMKRANVETPSKFRQIMEAYQKESEYGRTIESYQGELELDGSVRSVEFLRVGRLALVYQTIDRRESGYWHPQRHEWVPLDRDYHRAIRQGIRMASRQSAPQLIELPVLLSEVQP